jgi:uncharacterized membrane protein YjjB (DUF3815 family)
VAFKFDIYQLMHFLYNNVLVYNVNIKTLKTLKHVSISIQIILRELVVSSLKSLILKLLKI